MIDGTRLQAWKSILALAWPLIVAQSFWNLQVTIDRIFLGQYSTDALAAAMAVMGVFWVPMALIQQTASYGSTFVAQYYGAGKFDRIGPSIWHSVFFSICGGLCVIGLIPLGDWFFSQLGHTPEVVYQETEYFRGLCWSALPTGIVAALSAYFTGQNKTKPVIVINGVGLLVNAGLDYAMIFGNFGFPEMGAFGAGIATALAACASVVTGAWLIWADSNRSRHEFSNWSFDSDLMKRFLRYGVPSGLQWAFEGMAFTVFIVIVGKMNDGSAAMAASSIAITLLMLAILPPMGIATAVSMKVGQYIGEKKPEDGEVWVYRGLEVSWIYISIIVLTFIFVPQLYINLFESRDHTSSWVLVFEKTRVILWFLSICVFFDTMNFLFSFSLKGAGDTKFVTSIALTLPWPLMVLPTYLVYKADNALYWAWGFASLFIVAQGCVFWLRFKQGKWKSMSVIS
jgi:MATE family multidrug resistance protein